MHRTSTYLIATYNDIESVKKLVDANASDLAAILLEPMLGSGGAIPADADFLHQLKSLASNVGALLIFDEVMTSRMHSGGGIQSELSSNCRPDMTTLGKYIGGGMSFGAFGGRCEIMDLFDPRKPGGLAHAGTFNNNVLTMAAGRAGLEQVFTPQRAQVLHQTGEKLRKQLNSVARGTLLKVTGCGSIMCFHFTKTDVERIRSSADVADADVKLSSLLHLFLLQEGFYIARRGFLSLSLAVPETCLHDFVQVIRNFVEQYRAVL
ncbi:putative aminotransferase class-III, pyridoxal phosphate-dependent transferase, major [Septoria linicola]|nr:putative aminotransferase class-III, pyridoxal phosphate-dependent transferase, major [Septoria linicola]